MKRNANLKAGQESRLSFWSLIYSLGTNHNRTFYLQGIVKQITDILDLLINKNIPLGNEKPFKKVTFVFTHFIAENITCRDFDTWFVAIFLEQLSYFSQICCISLHQYFTCLHKVINFLPFRTTLAKTGINIFL